MIHVHIITAPRRSSRAPAKAKLPSPLVPALLDGLGLVVATVEACVEPAEDVEFPEIWLVFPAPDVTFVEAFVNIPWLMTY